MATNKDLDAQSREASVEKSTMNQVAKHLVPFLALMFFINFLDRTAISFAAPHGMNQDLGLTAAQFGFASGIFFIGYIILEVPSNLALHKFGARKWLARIMISWGIVAVLFTFVQSATQLYWLRFLLGVAEAGFFPGAILCLSMWAPARHRARMLGLFYIAQPLTTAIGAPLAGGLHPPGYGHRLLDLRGATELLDSSHYVLDWRCRRCGYRTYKYCRQHCRVLCRLHHRLVA